MNVYLIVVKGQGDEAAAVVDQETWDWIHSDPPKDLGVIWDELPTMPARVRDAIVKEGDPEGGVVTIGSHVNDRALVVIHIEGAALYASYGDSDEEIWAKKWIRENEHTLVDRYDGMIY
jgi:hypothetical protein